jgi:hypothetical protein
MTRSKFSEEQVAYALRQADGGAPVGDVCCQLGVIMFPTRMNRRWRRVGSSLDGAEDQART